MSSKIPKKSFQSKNTISVAGSQRNGSSNISSTRGKLKSKATSAENNANTKSTKSPPLLRRRNLSPQKQTSSSPSPKALSRTTNLLRSSPISSSLRDLRSATTFSKTSKRPTGPDRRGISEIKRFVILMFLS